MSLELALGQEARSYIISKHRVVFLTHKGTWGQIEGRTLTRTGMGLGSSNTCPVHPLEKWNCGTWDGTLVQSKDGGIEATLVGLVDPAKEGL